MEQKNRKCLLCKRNIADSWAELEDHLLSRDDVPEDVIAALKSKEYHSSIGDELYFMEIPIPIRYHHRDDEELLDADETHDPAYNYIYFEDIHKHARVPKEKIKHTQLHVDLCDICATVLQHIHHTSNQYADDAIQDTCITQDAKLTTEIVITKVTDPN